MPVNAGIHAIRCGVMDCGLRRNDRQGLARLRHLHRDRTQSEEEAYRKATAIGAIEKL